MKYLLLFGLGMGQMMGLQAQKKAYFQQEVHYQIDVKLDDRLHALSGTLKLTYTNHSPDELSFLWFHLWPNAYRDQTTAFARQQLRTTGTEFYFTKDDQLGSIDSLQFSVEGRSARLEYHEQHPDIARLWLPEILQPGESITIATPFRVKIPYSFSRLGHVGQSYQITQWYPKPAVYDRDGWHPMPYLDQGEFYSEFGSFDVRITLPENYVVAATGSLQTAAEKDFLARKVSETQAYLDSLALHPNLGFTYEAEPPSSENLKTIRFTADKVHDFAWFADKRFKVQQDRVHTPSGREVLTWTMFTETEEQLWRKSIDYVNRALQFFSTLIGDYPYPQVTAVQSALGAGGGMEYPMITVIGLAGSDRSLDEVIAHEVGHNWFYGLLASNERDHPWLDEGLTSFYEQRYMQSFYPPDRPSVVPQFFADKDNFDLAELLYQMHSRKRKDQAPDTPSENLTALNYWLSAYEKPAKALWWLYHYWGQEKFDKAMQRYFQDWEYRHPGPEDLQRTLEEQSGENLAWLFDGLLFSNRQVDFAINDLKKNDAGWELTIENKGEVAAPLPISGLKNGDVVYQQWVEPFEGRKNIQIPSAGFDQVVIDPFHWILDIDRKNNRIKTGGLLRKLPPFRLAPLARLENERYTSLYGLPFIGWNNYDGVLAGLLIHNRTIPQKKVEFDFLPLYGFKTRSLNGLGNIDLNHYPEKGIFQRVRLGVNYRSFHFRRNDEPAYDLRYRRWQPILTLGLRRPVNDPFTHQLQYRLILLSKEKPLLDGVEGFLGLDKETFSIHEWSYRGENIRHLNPFHYIVALEHQAYTDDFGRNQQYLKGSLEWESQFHYKPQNTVTVRIFAGGFLSNTRRRGGAIFPGAFSLIDQASVDYRFDDFYFARSDREGFWTQQLTRRDGGFKTPISPAFNLGKSNNFIFAVNLKADLPFGKGFPVRPYFDLGYFDNAMPTGQDAAFSDQLLWSGGIAVEILDGRFGIYFPLVNSRNLQDRLLEQGNYWNRIAFRFDLYGEKLRELWERTW